MEALIIIGVIAFCFYINREPKENEAGKFKINMFQEKDDKENFEYLALYIKGIIHCPEDNYPITVKTELIDVGSGAPIIPLADEFNYKNDNVFCHVQENVLPYKNTVYHEWVNILNVPIDYLLFPYSGRREIRAVVEVVDESNQTVLQRDRKNIELVVEKNKSYSEFEANIIKYNKLTLELALFVANSDGMIKKGEMNIIHQFIEKCSKANNISDPSEVKYELIEHLKSLKNKKEPSREKVNSICDKINKVAIKDSKYEIIRLCMDIIANDKKLVKEESILLEQIAENIKIDMKKYREMFDKKISLKIDEIEDTDRVLGIVRNMTKEEIKVHLRQQYRKWRALTTHSEKNKRKKAEKMLQLISEKRSKII